jgi:Tfp pilus assembly protein PilO
MDLSGTYDELANFFYYVGRMTRIVNVRDISLTRSSSGLSAEGELKVTALATTFRYKRPDEAGAGGPK